MFTDKELEVTEDFCERKIEDVLKRKDGSDISYISDLQTLLKLKDAAKKEGD